MTRMREGNAARCFSIAGGMILIQESYSMLPLLALFLEAVKFSLPCVGSVFFVQALASLEAPYLASTIESCAAPQRPLPGL